MEPLALCAGTLVVEHPDQVLLDHLDGDPAVGLAHAHPGAAPVDHPGPDDGLGAVEVRQRAPLLVDPALGAVAAAVGLGDAAR